MIELLNRQFINSTIIIPEMKNAAERYSDSTAIEWAKTLQQEFSYPVDTIVLSSKGEPLSQISIEEMFQTSRSGKIGRSYRDMLQEALNASDQ